MKTIKIFLASSEELEFDRMAFGNLVRRLNDIYEKRGISIKLFEWEDYDAAFNNQRKQDEYNDVVRQSDMFLALFHKSAGKFTVEEFDVATEEFKRHASPKIYVYCRDLMPGEEEGAELKEFKQRLFDELGHYWCRYNNKDSMQLHFVMQLQLVENSQISDLKVENGNVTLEGHAIARMDNLQFAAANKDYQKMSEELSSSPAKIEKARLRLDKFPDDEDLIDDLQQKLNRYNKLKEEFEEYQKLLFNTAKRITQLQGARITDRMRRAMDAFSEGRAHEANVILNEAEADACRALEDFRQSKEITEQKRQNVFLSIEELQLKASSLMADVGIPIEDRISQVKNVYAQANEMAMECDYDRKKYIDFLFEYGEFLYNYSFYDEALKVFERAEEMCIQEFGKEHPSIAVSYNNIGVIYEKAADYDKALGYHMKAVEIREKVLGKEHPHTALSYNNIGLVYHHMGDYDKAQEYHMRSLEIRERVLGLEHPDTAQSYNNIGIVYCSKGDYDKSLEYIMKSVAIDENFFGLEHSETANMYHNIGFVYASKGNYNKAMDYDLKALAIRERVLGLEHPDTALSYNNIGLVYHNKGDYDKSLDYLKKSVAIWEKIFGPEHPHTALLYNNIGGVYENKGDYEKTVEYYLKSLAILEKVLGHEHPNTATLYNNIGFVLSKKGDYDKALEYYLKSVAIREKVLGLEHPTTATSYNNIGSVYDSKGDYDKALEYYLKAKAVREKVLGHEHPDTATSFNNIGLVYSKIGDFDKALEYSMKAKDIRETILGNQHPDTIDTYRNIGYVYREKGEEDKAKEWFDKAGE